MFAISRVSHQADLGRDCASALSLNRGSQQRPGRVLTRAVRPWPVIRKTNPAILNLGSVGLNSHPVILNLIQNPSNPTPTPDPAIVDCFAR